MRKAVSVFIASLVLLLLTPAKIFAQDKTINDFNLDKKVVVTQNPYFAYGDNVTVSGTVNGDTYVAGGKVVIDGNINGDLLVTGGQVDILGSVKEDVRVIGGQVDIKGKVGKNVSVAGGQVKIEEGSVITGSLVGVGGDVDISGQINGNTNFAAGTIVVNGKINKDLQIASKNISLNDKASILGKFESWTDVDPVISKSAVVKGETIKHPMPVKIDVDAAQASKAREIFKGISVTGKIMGVISLLIIGYLMIKMSKKFMLKTADTAIMSFWKSMGIGFAIVFLTPMAFILLLITIIGAPLALIVLVVYFVMLYLAKIFAIYALGVKMMPQGSPYISYLLALLLYTLLTLVPVIGGITSFVALLVGMGSYFVAKKESLSE